MPFDGENFVETKLAVQIIDRMIERLGDRNNWCQGDGGIRGDARCIGYEMQSATLTVRGKQWEDNEDDGLIRSAIGLAIRQIFPVRAAQLIWDELIPGFNDHRQTTHADVLRVLRKARENLMVQP